VALYTYGLVEWNEIRDFVADFGGLGAFIQNLNIDLAFEILINGLMNFVVAISWPLYWMDEFDAGRIWIWGGIAYVGYWFGIKAAMHIINNRPPTETSD